MQGIIWIASYPKSGNTWMRAFLANLLSDSKEPVPFEEISGLCPGEALKVYYHKFYGPDFPVDNNLEVCRTRTDLQQRLAASSQLPIFLKTHSYLGQANGFDMINTQITLGSIYMVRNPLDVAISAAPHFNVSIDQSIKLMATAHMASQSQGKLVFEKTTDWSTHVRSWTPEGHPNFLVLRYEDMLEDPLSTFGKAVKFLNIKKPQKDVRRAIKNSSFKTLQTMEKAKDFGEKPDHAKSFFRKGSSGQWQDVLTKDQVASIIDTHREQMERFGYIPEGY